MNLRLFYTFLFVLFAFFACKQANTYPTEDIYIEFTDNILVDKYVPVELSYNDLKLKGKIKRRGGFSIGFPKYSYELDFDKNISLCELKKDDDWILNANYIDKTFLRHTLSYDLFKQMNPLNIAADYHYVRLFENNQYAGLYVLMEKIDKSVVGLNDIDSFAFIFKEPKVFMKDEDFLKVDTIPNFHQQTYPSFDSLDYNAYLNEVRSFLLKSSDKEFDDSIQSIFDINNIVDWHLLLLVSNNSDGILKNFYLYKRNASSPLQIIPWDYDHSFGRDGDNELNLNERMIDLQRSLLFNRLLNRPWYTNLLKDKWNLYQQLNILDKDSILANIENYENSLKEVVNENANKWPYDGPWYYDSNNFEQEITIIEDYLDERYVILEKYFQSLD